MKGFIVLNSLTLNGAWPSQLFPLKKVCILVFRGDAEISINALTLRVITQYNQITPLPQEACSTRFPGPRNVSPLDPVYLFPFQKFLAKPHETKEKAWQWVCFQPLHCLKPGSLCLVLSPKTVRGSDRVPRGAYPRSISFCFSCLECLRFSVYGTLKCSVSVSACLVRKTIKIPPRQKEPAIPDLCRAGAGPISLDPKP